jgi:hypothetical protein
MALNPDRWDMPKSKVLEIAGNIRVRYEEEGMNLTLRQMYYQFVAKGHAPSGQAVYKRIGDVLTDARYEGTFPIEGLVDRGRDVTAGAFTYCDRSVSYALSRAADTIKWLPEGCIRTDRWFFQPNHVSVWVEKQALEGIFEPVCNSLGVSWFACKGYPSVSALWDWVKAAQSAHKLGGCTKSTVLYFGDHDPDGWEIPRSALRNLNKLLEVRGIELQIEFKRIALTMEQVKKYNPPPFEAKITSSRYSGYVNEHDTEEAWELDALEPTVLRDLIKEQVDLLFDRDIYDDQIKLRNDRREAMSRGMQKPNWLSDILADMGDDD